MQFLAQPAGVLVALLAYGASAVASTASVKFPTPGAVGKSQQVVPGGYIVELESTDNVSKLSLSKVLSGRLDHGLTQSSTGCASLRFLLQRHSEPTRRERRQMHLQVHHLSGQLEQGTGKFRSHRSSSRE